MFKSIKNIFRGLLITINWCPPKFFSAPPKQIILATCLMIQNIKTIYGLDFSKFFEFTRDSIPYNIKGHSLLLKVKESRLDIRKYFFSVRAIKLWNELSENTVSSRNIDIFKKNLDLDMDRMGYV